MKQLFSRGGAARLVIPLVFVHLLPFSTAYVGVFDSESSSTSASVLAQPKEKKDLSFYSAQIPYFFECEGVPSWEAFMQEVRIASQDNFRKISRELFQMAHDIVSIHNQHPYPPQGFFTAVCQEDERMWIGQVQTEIANEFQNPYQPFCLYGFVTALFIRSRVFLDRESAAEHGLKFEAEAPDVHGGAQTLQEHAEQDLQYATTCLGKEGAVDFLDSTRLGFNILDIFSNINQTTYIKWEDWVAQNPVVRPPEDEFGAVFPFTILPKQFQNFENNVAQQEQNKDLNIAVFGTHATLNMEPVHMLSSFVFTDRKIKPVYYGVEERFCGLLGMCDRGDPQFSQFFRRVDQDPYAFSWAEYEKEILAVYERDPLLNSGSLDLLLCTEPLVGCLMLQKLYKEKQGKRLPLLAYLGVALLIYVPPYDLKNFWNLLDEQMEDTVIYTNNRVLREQVFYQTGIRAPYVRSHGLYTNAVYTPLTHDVLFWRAPLFVYPTMRCAIQQFLRNIKNTGASFPGIRFLEEQESMEYSAVALFRMVILLPWDHALMTYFELYSMGMPLMLPKEDWIYRFIYQRGQLSVGEPLYQSVHPGRKLKVRATYENVEERTETYGPPPQATALPALKAARGIAEDMLTRASDESLNLAEVQSYVASALDLVRDMNFFITLAENKTDTEDSYTSFGKVRKFTSAAAEIADFGKNATDTASEESEEDMIPWHPYTPWQMSPRDSNEWVRMRKGTWWARRGVRLEAMRYWFQFSDFARFPGVIHFDSIPDMLMKIDGGADTAKASSEMKRYNQKTLVHSVEAWTSAIVKLMG